MSSPWSHLTSLRKVAPKRKEAKEIKKLLVSLQIPIIKDPATGREFFDHNLYQAAYLNAFPHKMTQDEIRDAEFEKQQWEDLKNYMKAIGEEE